MFFTIIVDLWGFIGLNAIQGMLTGNVLTWDKCQAWGGLGFARQRQGRKKEGHLERNEQQRPLAEQLAGH